MINLYTSNRMEVLVNRLAGNINDNMDPFARPAIVVQSKGMQRWVSLRLAEQLGVVANIDFPFPRAFILGVLRECTDLRGQDPFSVESMAWRIYAADRSILPEKVREYVEGSPLKAYQLAMRLANLFSDYMQYRPALIMQWSGLNVPKGVDIPPLEKKDEWQRELWKMLLQGNEKHLLTARLMDFLHMDEAGGDCHLPPGVHLFGMSSLSPLYLNFFQHLSRFTGVSLYYLSPTKEFWAYTVSERQQIKTVLKDGKAAYLDVGNPLLSSLGVLSRNYSKLVLSMDFVEQGEEEFRENNQDEDLLHQVQNDMLKLENPAKGCKRVVRPGDRSLMFHVCHSPMREVEVLRDQLLLLMRDRGVQPYDVLVMTPDMDKYAPYIEAVFGNPETRETSIPYTIADAPPMAGNQVLKLVMDLANLPQSRFRLSEVLTLFENPVVYPNFGLDEDDLPQVRSWLEESGIRWGLDADFRKRELGGKAGFEANSWEFGVNRLLLGWAMAQGRWQGIAPLDIPSSLVEVMGGFVEFVQRLKWWYNELKHPHNPLQWQELFSEMTSEEHGLLHGRDREVDRTFVEFTGQMARLVGNMAAVQGECVPVDVMRQAIEDAILDRESAMNFLFGGVTFCRMRPMRSIPAKVIWLLGMDDGVFPRSGRRPDFDITGQKPRPGDRNPRLDDRNLFLETLLSVRQTLVISHVGRGLIDNAPKPASVVVEELKNYVRRYFVLPGQAPDNRDALIEALTTVHPLQAFSPRYFQSRELRSFSIQNLEGARAALSKRTRPVEPWKVRRVSGELPTELDANQLISFLKRPSKAFLEHCVGIKVRDTPEWLPQDDEPMACALDFFRESDALAALLQGGSQREILDQWNAEGILPPGKFGQERCGMLLDELQKFADKTKGYGWQQRLAHMVDVKLDKVRVRGRISIDGTADNQLMVYRYSKNQGSVLLEGWVKGLVLVASGVLMVDRVRCVFRERDKGYATALDLKIPQPEDALKILNDLVGLYIEGMQTPLPFFVHTSFAYKNHGKKLPEDAARAEWEPSFHRPGEYAADGNDLLFPMDLLDQDAHPELLERFKKAAELVFGQMTKAAGIGVQDA